jgi:outer membrane immunogenic protein
VAPTWLIYLTGGLAVGEIKSTTNIQFGTDQIGLGNFSGSDTVTRLGWTVGAGMESALSSNWTIKVEYLFLDFGSFTYMSPCTTAECPFNLFNPLENPFAWQTHVRANESVFRLGVNYKFGSW